MTPAEILNNILHWEKSEIQSQILKHDALMFRGKQTQVLMWFESQSSTSIEALLATLLSEPWIGVTRFTVLHKLPPEGHTWVPDRLTILTTTRPGHTWSEEQSNIENTRTLVCSAAMVFAQVLWEFAWCLIARTFL